MVPVPLSPGSYVDGVKIVPKGKRLGHEISWETLLWGDVELRRDLHISVDAYRGG
jgi:hypothetical protein